MISASKIFHRGRFGFFQKHLHVMKKVGRFHPKLILNYAVKLLLVLLALILALILYDRIQEKINLRYVITSDLIVQRGNSGIRDAHHFNFTCANDNDVKMHMKKINLYTSTDWENLVYRLAEENKYENNYLIMTVSNFGLVEYTLNWIASLVANGYSKFLIVCLDMKLYESLVKHGYERNSVVIPSSWTPKELQLYESDEALFGTKKYCIMTYTRSFCTQKLLRKKFNIILNDVDLVWLSPSIISYFDTIHKHTTFAYMRDFEENDDINTGFYLIRSNALGRHIVDSIVKEQITNRGVDNDQVIANRVITRLGHRGTKHILPLDYVLFATGFVGYKWDLNRKLGISPVIFHANYATGKEKLDMLKGLGYWFID